MQEYGAITQRLDLLQQQHTDEEEAEYNSEDSGYEENLGAIVEGLEDGGDLWEESNNDDNLESHHEGHPGSYSKGDQYFPEVGADMPGTDSPLHNAQVQRDDREDLSYEDSTYPSQKKVRYN